MACVSPMLWIERGKMHHSCFFSFNIYDDTLSVEVIVLMTRQKLFTFEFL